MVLIPVFAILAVAYGRSVATGEMRESLRWWALAVFVFAATTDGIDGWVARRFNQRSDFGAFIDPLADKGLLLTGVTVLGVLDWGEAGWRLPLWFVLLVWLRDAIILFGILYLKSGGQQVKIAPHWSGKLCTVVQMTALGWVMLRWIPLSPQWPCLVAGLVTIWSGINYIQQGLRILEDRRRLKV